MIHIGPDTTYSTAEAVEGDPSPTREVSSWWDGNAREDGELHVWALSSLANHVAIPPIGLSWRLLMILHDG